MGLDTELLRLLLDARGQKVSFRQTLTLGRQHYFVGNTETRKIFREYGLDADRHPDLLSPARPRYSEPFWKAIGVERLDTLDASDFEGATLVHDLNQPIPGHLAGQYDTVCDAGTLEHVFQFPTAIRNCMELVRVGGHLLLFTTANNYFGHGFYQFSPELFYRVLSAANGFQVERMVAVEYGPRRRHFEVSDPEAIRRRVNLINSYPVLLFVQARRLAAVPIFKQLPQQSDYVAMWSQSAVPGAVAGSSSLPLIERLKRLLVERTPGFARFLEAFRYSAWNRGFSFRDTGSFKRSR